MTLVCKEAPAVQLQIVLLLQGRFPYARGIGGLSEGSCKALLAAYRMSKAPGPSTQLPASPPARSQLTRSHITMSGTYIHTYMYGVKVAYAWNIPPTIAEDQFLSVPFLERRRHRLMYSLVLGYRLLMASLNACIPSDRPKSQGCQLSIPVPARVAPSSPVPPPP